MDMGITQNVPIHIVKLAPLGDPIEIRLRGYELSLRKQEAAFVFVEKRSRGMTYQFALVGNPNSGQNQHLQPTDGAKQTVGNWPE